MTRLEDCFTTVEKKMIAEGAFVQVRETRTMFQDWMRPRFTEIVEDATGRSVAAFFSQVSHDPDIAVEPPDQQFANLARAPVRLLGLQADDQALDLLRQLVGIAHRPS